MTKEQRLPPRTVSGLRIKDLRAWVPLQVKQADSGETDRLNDDVGACLLGTGSCRFFHAINVYAEAL